MKKKWRDVTQEVDGLSSNAKRAYRRWKNKQKKRAAKAFNNSGVIPAFYHSPEWLRVRYEALKRSRGHCECCGASPADGARMNVDHIKPRHKFPALALDIDNLQVLCARCNAGKGGWDQTDWRPPSAEMTERELDLAMLHDLRARGLLN